APQRMGGHPGRGDSGDLGDGRWCVDRHLGLPGGRAHPVQLRRQRGGHSDVVRARRAHAVRGVVPSGMDTPSSRSAFARLTTLGLVWGGIGAFLAGMWENTRGPTFDASLLFFVVAHRRGWLTDPMRTVTWLGSRWILAPLIAVVGGFFVFSHRDWRPGTRL